jgi:hypothetical protein
MKQASLTRKHKIALTSGTFEGAITEDLVALGLVEKKDDRYQLPAAGSAKSAELKLGLAGRGPVEE